MRSKFRLLLASAALSLWVATPGYASFITWEVNEVFSNADGTIQFVEFFEANNQNGQRSFDGKQLKTFVTGASSNDPLSALTFTVDLPSDFTASKFALIATQGFATQPGAVQPDFVMPDGFIDPSVIVEIKLGNIDEFSFPLGAIPTDGANSLYRTGAPIGPNSPTNFAGQTGSIGAPLATWEVNEVFSNADGTIQFVEFYEVAGQNGRRLFDGEQLKTFATGASPNDPLNVYDFTADLPSRFTANEFALVATQGFASLPGAVEPDFVMPDGFIDLSMVVEIELAGVDEFGFILGAIPTDGTNSLHRTGAPLGLNSPTNFARQTGSIDLPEPSPAALGGAAMVCLANLRARGSRRIRRQRGCPPPPFPPPRSRRA